MPLRGLVNSWRLWVKWHLRLKVHHRTAGPRDFWDDGMGCRDLQFDDLISLFLLSNVSSWSDRKWPRGPPNLAVLLACRVWKVWHDAFDRPWFFHRFYPAFFFDLKVANGWSFLLKHGTALGNSWTIHDNPLLDWGIHSQILDCFSEVVGFWSPRCWGNSQILSLASR